ncbi:E2 protein [Papillomaviridae sp. Haddock_c45]|nr:E2 protein [Papillomaviridae sp. Haddock_c45]
MSPNLEKQLLTLDKAQFKLKEQLAKAKHSSYQELLAVIVLEEEKLKIEVEIRKTHPGSSAAIHVEHIVIPSLQVCNARLKVQLRLTALLKSFAKTPYVNSTTWTLQELSTESIFHTEPKGVIKSTSRLRVATVWWKNFYFQEKGLWTHSYVNKPDDKGMFYDRDGTKVYYHLFPQTNLTSTDLDRPSDQRKHDNSRTNKRGLHSSRHSSDTDAGDARASTSQSQHGRSGGRATATSPLPSKRARKGKDKTPAEGVAAALVGSDKLSVRGGVGNSRLARLISEARDPPGLCIAGPIETLKGIRRRLVDQHTPPFTSYTITTKSYDRLDKPTSAPFFMIFFKDTRQSLTFLQNFKIYARSVVVSRIHFNGLPPPDNSQED